VFVVVEMHRGRLTAAIHGMVVVIGVVGVVDSDGAAAAVVTSVVVATAQERRTNEWWQRLSTVHAG